MRYFIDVEASSLNVGSHPIEVGWCDEDGIGEACLIHPPSHWTDWSVASQSVHGISREQLVGEGRSVEHVARRALAMFSRAESVYSDAPEFDGAWLEDLFHAAVFTRPAKLRDVVDLYGQECLALLRTLPPPAHRQYDEEVRRLALDVRAIVDEAKAAERARVRVRHRALPDAQGLRWTWRDVQSRVRALAG